MVRLFNLVGLLSKTKKCFIISYTHTYLCVSDILDIRYTSVIYKCVNYILKDQCFAVFSHDAQ